MAYMKETADQAARRVRNGKITAVLAVTWWVVAIGGILWVLNNPPA